MNEVKLLMFGFLNLAKVSGSYTVDFAIEQQTDVVCKRFALVYFVFLVAAPTPYVQAAILHQSHP